jgi:hypothetical protein
MVACELNGVMGEAPQHGSLSNESFWALLFVWHLLFCLRNVLGHSTKMSFYSWILYAKLHKNAPYSGFL